LATRVFSPGIKEIRREVYLLSSVVEVKKQWSYTATPYTRLHGVNRDKFTSLYRMRKTGKFS
jgi:hypothetical protein